jgi:glycosyltransferase involved in cell wall biosynthesis
MSNNPRLTILWHSVAPFIESGYGRVTRNVCVRLAQAGYKVINSCYYGVEPGGILNFNGVYVIASKEGQFGMNSAINYSKYFNPDVSVLHTDWWAFADFPKHMKNPIIYSPMDHESYPEEIVNFTKQYWHIIPFTEWQKNVVLKGQMGIDSDPVIPHGVDTQMYKPLNKIETKKASNLGDKFVFLTVNANSDKDMGGGRKSWGPMMKAVRLFLDNNKDQKEDNFVWLCHTNPQDPRGFPLMSMSHKFKLDKIVKFPSPETHYAGLSEPQMCELFNTGDVFLGASKREGFGLTFLESMSCGTPVVGHDFAAVPDLIRNRGWLCKSVAPAGDLNIELSPILGNTAIPDVYDLEKKISEAYYKEDLRKKYAEDCRKFVVDNFQWDKIMREGWFPFLERVENELKPRTLSERRLL